jgi:hypothetical protein
LLGKYVVEGLDVNANDLGNTNGKNGNDNNRDFAELLVVVVGIVDIDTGYANKEGDRDISHLYEASILQYAVIHEQNA